MKFSEARADQSPARAPAVRQSLAPAPAAGLLQIVCEWRRAKKRPLQAPFVTVCWQMLLGCLSQTHASLPPSAPLHQMACFAFSHGSPWAALSPQLLEAQRHTGSYARSRLWPASILTNVLVFFLPSLHLYGFGRQKLSFFSLLGEKIGMRKWQKEIQSNSKCRRCDFNLQVFKLASH